MPDAPCFLLFHFGAARNGTGFVPGGCFFAREQKTRGDFPLKKLAYLIYRGYNKPIICEGVYLNGRKRFGYLKSPRLCKADYF